MVDLDKIELKKLSPEERIKKLKELEEERKKEIDEAEKMIKDSVEEMQRDKAVEDVEMPEAEHVDISQLFAPEGDELERTVAREAPHEEEKEEQVSYQVKKSLEELEGLSYRDLNRDDREKLDEIDHTLKDIDYHNVSKDTADQLVASRTVLYHIKKYAGML